MALAAATAALPELGPHRLVDRGRRRLFDDLLVASLHRALALEQRHDGAVRVAEDLHLEVARRLDESLQEHRAVPERGLGLACSRRDRVGEVRGIVHQPHAAAAAAHRRLHHHREAGVGRRARRVRAVSPGATSPPGRIGTPTPAMIRLASSFEPIRSIASGAGPTNVSPASAHARANSARSERNP